MSLIQMKRLSFSFCPCLLPQGRIAMLGFTGILLTEYYTMMPTWQFWAEKLSGHSASLPM